MRNLLPTSAATMGAPWVTRGLFKRSGIRSAACKVGLLGLLTAGTTLSAQAQFPVNEAFTGTTSNNFIVGGNASLPGGYLRLTDNSADQAGYAVLKGSFPAPSGFSISFEFYSYGGTSTAGADGISVFLVDALGTNPTITPSEFTIGAFGGSLGFAQKTVAGGAPTNINGATKGYLGIGIDEFGNFATSTEGRVGGYPTTANGTTNTTTRVPQSVTLRGAGTGLTGYPYLTSSGPLLFNLNVPTTRAPATSPDYRKAYIYVIPQADNTYKITVRIQHGPTDVATTTYNYSVPKPPDNLRVGFAGSTGGSNDYHEIRNLSIVQNPIAADDAVQTPYNRAITFSVVANDKGVGATLAPGTVDLDPSTIAADKTLTVAGQGTFSVDNNGNVTFTPSGTFSGVVSIPYTVADITGALSNPAMISVTVTGADVQTVVSGPTAINPGTMTAYTVTTTNNGVETATNVRPTLALPAGFTVFGTLPAGASASTDAITGVTTVTFAPTTLTARQSTTNSVQVTASNMLGSYSLTSNYTYPGTFIPDAEPTNNSSTLAVTVGGATNIAGVCSIPGKDGPLALVAGTIPNTYYAGVSTSVDKKTLTISTSFTGGAPIAAGDLLLVMQMQGATILTANDATYGTVSGTPTAGKYEYAVATSAVSGSGTLTLAKALTNAYTYNSSTSTTTPFQQFQVIRIPQYSSLTLSGAVSGLPWNGATGGVLALEVAGTTTFTTGSSLNMDGKGFRGGAGRTTAAGSNGDYVVARTANTQGSKGEGIAGIPFQVYTGSVAVNSVTTTIYENYAVGSFAHGQAASGGGGGTIGTSTANHAGGGGGSNGGTGGAGGAVTTGGQGSRSVGGDGGIRNSYVTGATAYLGGGGGAGTTTDATNQLLSSGGTGGGIIILKSNSVSGTATTSANGTDGRTPGTGSAFGGGGGGAGGTIVLSVNSGSNNLTAQADGGDGGNSTHDGGGGSGGLVFSNAALKTAASVAAGANGTGAGGGAALVNVTTGTDCTPTLTTALRTTIPQVARSNNMQTAYVYTVSNTGGGITGLTATPSLAAVTTGTAGLFTYTSMSSAVIQNADGSSQTLVAGTDYTVSNSGTSTPTFTLVSSLVVASGASVVFTFAADIASTAVVGTVYGSNAAATYLNPQRTTVTGNIAAPAYASSSADQVTIVTPLPVVLTSFDVLAVRQDALLTWATASEQNNDHFVVERSVTGTDFVAVGTVRGQGTSARATSYTFTDAGIGRQAASTVYYRLRPVAVDGTSTFSPVRAVKFAASAKTAAALYPNPSQGQTTLDLSGLATGTYSVQVLDLAGRVLRTQEVSSQTTLLDLAGLPQGAYLVLVQGAGVRQALPLLRN